MCETFLIDCQCGNNTAELFFGKMLLGRSSVTKLFCPACSEGYEEEQPERLWDNGWVLELNMDVVRSYAASFGVNGEALTASWIFDCGYVTWAGITPTDSMTRNREREKIQKLAKTDMLAYLEAMKAWGNERERRFSEEGWRKMRN